MDKAIIASGITKKYKLYDNTKERLMDLVTPKKYGEDFYALTNVNFEANQGEVIGFIGINGSGKSTFSNIIAGIVPETSGSVTVNGQVALIAVSAGLKNDLTGRDNIELKLLMLGFSKEEIKNMEPVIIEFAELEKFIDQPVKSYSSGMKSRLGFAISVNVNPDILIIDEALSVGDKAFAEKSLNKMMEFKSEGKTMIFVSHSIGQMKKFCEKILWLEFGMVKEYGTVGEVIPKYELFLKKWQKMKKKERNQYRASVMALQKESLQGIQTPNQVDIDNFYKGGTNESYVEKPVSLLCHITGKEPLIYETPKDLIHTHSSKRYKDSAYYIKRKVSYKGELFYLLSTIPSGVKSIIGWMKAVDVSVHKHQFIDNDHKSFYFKGKGRAYTIPWGKKDNCVFQSLKSFEGATFHVTETQLVGKNAWYKGEIDGENVWVHHSHLKK